MQQRELVFLVRVAEARAACTQGTRCFLSGGHCVAHPESGQAVPCGSPGAERLMCAGDGDGAVNGYECKK